MSYINLVIFLLSFFASATSDLNAPYFKLHQATGFFEQFIGGHCSRGKKKAQYLLKSLKEEVIGTELEDRVNKLNKLIRGKIIPRINDLEHFRLSIHELQERLKLHHERGWHNVVLIECKGSHNHKNGHQL